ncbi:MAG TPA: apolipoprotein N-acyltransferase [Candidatus Obscuribacterales bacterium]
MSPSPFPGSNPPPAVVNAHTQPPRSLGGRRGRSPWLLVFLGGVLMGLTPAPVNGWPLAWIALAPLWWAVMHPTATRSRWQRFGLGALWSGVYHGIVLSWITHLHPLMWMGMSWGASVAIALFAWVFITGLGTVTFGLWAVLLRAVSDRCRLGTAGRILAGTALWCGLETMLSWGPLAWPFLAFTQSPQNLWMLHWGQYAGPTAVTAAIVAVNGCWAEMSLGHSAAASRSTRRWQPAVGGLLLLVMLHGLGWGLYRQPLGDRPEAALKIGLIQGNIPTRVKLTPAGTRQALAAYVEGYRALVAQGAEAVLTPEGAVPEVWTGDRQSRSPLRQTVIATGVPLWLGTFRPVDPEMTGALRQSLVNLDAQGQVTGQYNKVKLVPLGEYIPLEGLLGRFISRLSPVSSSLRPGSPDQVFETSLGRAIVGICYESAYSDLFRRQAAQGGEWMMTASNNDPYPPRMMMQHHAQDVMRAIESDRWAVRVTNTGISGVVTPHGDTLWLSEPNQYATYLTQIYRRQGQTLYTRWGNWLTYSLLGAMVVISGLSIRKSTRSR